MIFQQIHITFLLFFRINSSVKLHQWFYVMMLRMLKVVVVVVVVVVIMMIVMSLLSTCVKSILSKNSFTIDICDCLSFMMNRSPIKMCETPMYSYRYKPNSSHISYKLRKNRLVLLQRYIKLFHISPCPYLK